MVRSTWAALTADLPPADLALFEAYRTACAALPDTEERVHTTEVQYAVKRIFTAGYLKSHWLEVSIDLLREAEHPLLRAVFPTTKRVFTHRLTLGEPSQVDSIMDLVREAHDQVGPGT